MYQLSGIRNKKQGALINKYAQRAYIKRKIFQMIRIFN